MLLSYEEKGKCSAAKQGAEFPSIDDQPEAKANQWWPRQPATPHRRVEAGVDEQPGRVHKVGMAVNAFSRDHGRPHVVLEPRTIKSPIAGVPNRGSQGITEREIRSNATRGVGWTHSSDEDRADETQNLCLQKSTGGDCARRKPGPAKGSWSGMSERRRTG
jgi:hypothetical protein